MNKDISITGKATENETYMKEKMRNANHPFQIFTGQISEELGTTDLTVLSLVPACVCVCV